MASCMGRNFKSSMTLAKSSGSVHPVGTTCVLPVPSGLVPDLDKCTGIVYDNYMRCALYARVSTTDQNCEMQLRELREYIARRDWKIAGEYVDTGFSGAKASRPALDRLMADAAKRKFDSVAVWKIDRFGRSVLHLNQQLAALTSHGVRFIATSQSLDTDEKTPPAAYFCKFWRVLRNLSGR